jgi:hypothetical protein
MKITEGRHPAVQFGEVRQVFVPVQSGPDIAASTASLQASSASAMLADASRPECGQERQQVVAGHQSRLPRAGPFRIGSRGVGAGAGTVVRSALIVPWSGRAAAVRAGAVTVRRSDAGPS